KEKATKAAMSDMRNRIHFLRVGSRLFMARSGGGGVAARRSVGALVGHLGPLLHERLVLLAQTDGDHLLGGRRGHAEEGARDHLDALGGLVGGRLELEDALHLAQTRLFGPRLAEAE